MNASNQTAMRLPTVPSVSVRFVTVCAVAYITRLFAIRDGSKTARNVFACLFYGGAEIFNRSHLGDRFAATHRFDLRCQSVNGAGDRAQLFVVNLRQVMYGFRQRFIFGGCAHV